MSDEVLVMLAIVCIMLVLLAASPAQCTVKTIIRFNKLYTNLIIKTYLVVPSVLLAAFCNIAD